MTIFKKNIFEENQKAPLIKEAFIVIDTKLIVMSFNNEAKDVIGAALKHGSTLSFDNFIRPKYLAARCNKNKAWQI